MLARCASPRASPPRPRAPLRASSSSSSSSSSRRRAVALARFRDGSERPSVLVRARPDLDDDLASARAASARAAAAAALASVVAAASIHLARATPPAIAAAASASEASGYVGVGLEVYVAPDGYPTVIEFLPTKTSGPAHDAGVRINDKIAAVNGAETRAMRSLADVASALRGGGAGGDAVELTLLRRRGRTTETVAASVTRVGGITPNPRSCFVSSCARV